MEAEKFDTGGALIFDKYNKYEEGNLVNMAETLNELLHSNETLA